MFFFSENNRLSKPHFDWPLLRIESIVALYGGVGDYHCKLPRNPSPGQTLFA